MPDADAWSHCSSYVSSLDAVTPDGASAALSGPGVLADAKIRNAVVTEIAFKPAPTDDLWMIRESFAYPGRAEFAALVKALFVSTDLPRRCDRISSMHTPRSIWFR